jgi:hypothetical protein
MAEVRQETGWRTEVTDGGADFNLGSNWESDRTRLERAILPRGCLVHRHVGVEIAVELSRLAVVR